MNRRTQSAGPWLTVTAVLLLWTASGDTVLAQELFDEAFLRGDDLASLELHARRLTSGELGSIAGLEPAMARPVLAELELLFHFRQVRKVGDYPAAARTLESFLAQGHDPLVDTRARFQLGECLWRTGRNDEAREQWSRGGFLDRWWIIGPFDNERGSGFSRADPPEQSFDPTAVYGGKRQDVSWRQWEEPARGGFLPLHHLLRPAEEGQAYLLTHVHSEAERTVVLRVGSSCAFAIWLNGTEVARVDVERRARLDQNAIAVRLAAGWNRLLVKSSHTKGPWYFGLRVTELDGRPSTDLEPRTELPEGAVLAAGGGKADAIPVDHLATFAGVASTPEQRLLLGWWIGRRQAFDVSEHPDRDQYLAARDGSAHPGIVEYLIGGTYRSDITHAAEREENPWRHHLERALEHNPGLHRARLDLAAYYLERFGNLERLSEYLTPVLEAGVDTPRIQELAADLWNRRIGFEAARPHRERQRAHLARWLLPDLRVRESRRRAKEEGLSAARETLEAGLSRDSTRGTLRYELKRLATLEGREDDARVQLEALVRAHPDDPDFHRSLAEFHADREDWPRALESVERALMVAPDDEDNLRRRGDLLWHMDRRDAALDAFALSLAKEPNQPQLREYVELLSKGESDLEDPFRIAPEEIIQAALRREEEENAAARVLLDNQVVHINSDGTTKRYHQYLAKITNLAGLRRFDYYRIPYAYGEQWVKVLRAAVHHPDGRVEEARIRNRDPRVRAGEYPIWSYAWVDLPPIEVGDVVEIEYRREDLRQSFFGDYFGDQVDFAGTLPRDRTIYTLIAPRDKPLYFNQPGIEDAPEITETGDRKQWRWDVGAMARIEPEPRMPPLNESTPRVEVSTFESWDAFATWYYHLIRKQFESSPAIQEKVEELTAGLETPLEKIRAVYNFVVTDVRYIAWEFGVHGFKPYNASTIFTRRFGDCKDKATLICTMLGEVGIQAHPVLIYGTRNREREDFTLPLIGHFNHCIAYVPDVGDGTELFIDGTAKHHAVRQLPEMDRGAKVLIVRDGGGSVDDIEWNTPAERAITEQVRVRVRQDGSASIEQRNEFTGDYAVRVRSRFEIEGQRVQQLEEMFGRRFPGTRVLEVETSELDDLDVPVSMRIRLEVPDYLDDSGDGVKLPPLGDLFRSTLFLKQTASRSERHFDLQLGNPSQSELVLEIELPPGYQVDHLPENLQIGNDHAEFVFEATCSGNVLKIRRQLRIRSARVPVAEYPEFKKFADRVERFREERILLRRVQEVQ